MRKINHFIELNHDKNNISVQPMPKGDHVLNFSDAEDLINDEELKLVN